MKNLNKRIFVSVFGLKTYSNGSFDDQKCKRFANIGNQIPRSDLVHIVHFMSPSNFMFHRFFPSRRIKGDRVLDSMSQI